MALRLLPAAVLAAALVACGCKGEPNRFHVSGTVMFEGKPIENGRIYFDPDTATNKDGVQGYAEIKNGKYDTASTGGKGTSGGAVVIRVEAFGGSPTPDEPAGKPLFPAYSEKAEMPKSNTTRDISISKSATVAPKQKKEDPNNRDP